MKDLKKLLKIKKKDIISITGSGGKTSLMEKLGEELKEDGRVLMTTSTKILRPTNPKIDYVFDSFDSYKKPREKKVLVAMGNLDPTSNKLGGLLEEDLEKIKDDFDYILIEADGCRNLLLKMWKSYEPVIYNISTKVVSVFSAKVLGRKIKEDFIYNFEDFKSLVGEGLVDKEVFLKLITNKPGPFGDFKGEKIVFFNQVDSKEEKYEINKLIKYLRKNIEGIRYISGSLLKEEYYED